MNTLTELNTFSATTVAADDERLPSPGTTNFTRYEINGVIDPNKNVMSNIESLANSAATWITYDTSTGKWTCVINQSGTSSKSFSDSNIIGELKVTNTSLDNYYNSVEVEFPHKDLNDASDYIRIDIPAVDRKPNEPDNVLKLNYPLVNEQVQAQLLGFIELKQSRVDTVIEFTTDFTAIDLQAGDLIDVTNSTFGYTNKLFRVLQIKEVDNETLSLEITAMEYDANVYSTSDLVRYVRSNADGIITIGDIGKCGTPQITKTETDRVPHFLLETTVPDNTDPANPYGIVEGIEVWIYEVPAGELPTWETVDDESRTYTLLTTIKPQGEVFAPGADIDYNIYNLDASNFLLKVRGVNSVTKGPFSDLSGLVQYTPKQVTDQITNDTEINDNGSILASLGMSVLLRLLNGLLQNGDSGSGSLFEKIFEVFRDKTGVDIVGDAQSGSLVVAANVAVKDEGITVANQISSLNFVGDDVAVTVNGTDVTITHAADPGTPSPGPDPTDPYDPLATTIAINSLLPTDRTTFEASPTDTAPNYAKQTGPYIFRMPQAWGAYQLGDAAKTAKLYKSDGTLVETLNPNSTDVTIDNNVIKLNFADRDKGTDYYILLDEGFVTLCSRPSEAITSPQTWNFNTAPVYDATEHNQTGSVYTAGTLTFTTSVKNCLNGAEVTFDFGSRTPTKVGGNITVEYDSDSDGTVDTTHQTIAVSGGTVVDNTITYSINTLTAETLYKITTPASAFSANFALGCHTASGYNAETTTQFTSPAVLDVESLEAVSVVGSYTSGLLEYDSPTDFDNINTQSNITLNFNRDIAFGSAGTLTIYEDGSSWQVFDITDTFDPELVSEIFWISGDRLHLNPTKDMKPGSSYYLLADSGAIVSATCPSDVWAGTSDTTEYTWTTYALEPGSGTTIDLVNDTVEYDFGQNIAFSDPNANIVIKDGTGTVLATVNSSSSAVTLET